MGDCRDSNVLAYSEQVHREWLGSGLELVWLHVSHALQAALALELHGGSHDEPTAYPGLAHFLEHMVFRGSHGFAPGDGLMSHVQAHGGQVNASTRGTRTLFHFQIADAQLAAACARLVDQVQQPLLDVAAQQAEREVLEAEFRLRATDVDTLIDAAVGLALNPEHGAAAFHAGRRSSLPVESAAFQTALHDYHRRIYRQARVRVVIVSPRGADEGLQALGPLLQILASERDPRPPNAPPMLRLACAPALQLTVPGGAAHGLLVMALEQDGQGIAALLDPLNLALESSAPGSLRSALRAAGLASNLRLRLLHADAEQALLLADFHLLESGFAQRAALPQVLLDLLQHAQRELIGDSGQARFQAVMQRRWPSLGALEKARYLLEQPDPGHSARSLAVLVEQLRAGQYLLLSADQRTVTERRHAGFELALAAEPLPPAAAVSLPLSGPFCPALLPAPMLSPTTWRGAQQRPLWREPTLAALFLLWPQSVGHGTLLSQLQRRLRALQVQAWQQGVRLDLRQRGSALSLQLLGAAQALPAVLQRAITLLSEPWADAAGTDDAEPASGIALRQLLQALPPYLVDVAGTSATQLPEYCSALLLSDDHTLAAQLAAVMQGHGLRCDHAPPARGVAPTRARWQTQDLAGEECALLLFVPQPPGVLGSALWQLLGQLLPTPFQRRMREELQLGYALFCGYRVFDGQAGLLFAVQSERADARVLWAELQAFVQQQAQAVCALDTDAWHGAVERLRTQLLGAGSSLEEGAEILCQSWLAGQLDEHPQGQLAALAGITPADLGQQLQQLFDRPWLVLSSQDRPDA